MSLRIKLKLASDIPVPNAGYATYFIDTSNAPKLKLSSGVVVDAGATGSNLIVTGPVTTNTIATAGTVQLVNVTSNAVTVTLPSLHGSGDQIVVKISSPATFACTVAAAMGDFIDGVSSMVLNTDYESAALISDGINWFQIY